MKIVPATISTMVGYCGKVLFLCILVISTVQKCDANGDDNVMDQFHNNYAYDDNPFMDGMHVSMANGTNNNNNNTTAQSSFTNFATNGSSIVSSGANANDEINDENANDTSMESVNGNRMLLNVANRSTASISSRNNSINPVADNDDEHDNGNEHIVDGLQANINFTTQSPNIADSAASALVVPIDATISPTTINPITLSPSSTDNYRYNSSDFNTANRNGADAASNDNLAADNDNVNVTVANFNNEINDNKHDDVGDGDDDDDDDGKMIVNSTEANSADIATVGPVISSNVHANHINNISNNKDDIVIMSPALGTTTMATNEQVNLMTPVPKVQVMRITNGSVGLQSINDGIYSNSNGNITVSDSMETVADASPESRKNSTKKISDHDVTTTTTGTPTTTVATNDNSSSPGAATTEINVLTVVPTTKITIPISLMKLAASTQMTTTTTTTTTTPTTTIPTSIISTTQGSVLDVPDKMTMTNVNNDSKKQDVHYDTNGGISDTSTVSPMNPLIRMNVVPVVTSVSNVTTNNIKIGPALWQRMNETQFIEWLYTLLASKYDRKKIAQVVPLHVNDTSNDTSGHVAKLEGTNARKNGDKDESKQKLERLKFFDCAVMISNRRMVGHCDDTCLQTEIGIVMPRALQECPVKSTSHCPDGQLCCIRNRSPVPCRVDLLRKDSLGCPLVPSVGSIAKNSNNNQNNQVNSAGRQQFITSGIDPSTSTIAMPERQDPNGRLPLPISVKMMMNTVVPTPTLPISEKQRVSVTDLLNNSNNLPVRFNVGIDTQQQKRPQQQKQISKVNFVPFDPNKNNRLMDVADTPTSRMQPELISSIGNNRIQISNNNNNNHNNNNVNVNSNVRIPSTMQRIMFEPFNRNREFAGRVRLP